MLRGASPVMSTTEEDAFYRQPKSKNAQYATPAATEAPTLERIFKGHKEEVTSLSFAPNMKQIASGSTDGAVIIYNSKPQLRSFRLSSHKGAVYSVDFAPNSALVASAGADASVRLWTPSIKGDVTSFKGHSATIRTVRFSPDNGRQLLTSSDDKMIKLWHTETTRFLCTLGAHANWVRTSTFIPNGKMVISGSDDKSVRLWDITSKKSTHAFTDLKSNVLSVAAHPSNDVVAAATADGIIRLWDLRNLRLIQQYYATSSEESKTPTASVHSIEFGGDQGEWMLSSSSDGLVKLWDLHEGHLRYTLHAHKGAANAATFASRGGFFATSGADAEVMVWRADLSSYEPTSPTESEKAQFRYNLNDDEEGTASAAQEEEPQAEPQQPPQQQEKTTDFERQEATLQSSPAERQGPAPPTKAAKEQVSSPPKVKASASRPKHAIEETLQHIVHQIEMLTQTVSLVERRMTHLEKKVADA